jgi:hypothetical protein
MIVHKVFELNFKSPPSINLNLISLTPQSKTSYYQTVDIWAFSGSTKLYHIKSYSLKCHVKY